MDHEACNVVYVDRAAAEDTLVKREDLIFSALSSTPPSHAGEDASISGRAALNENLQALLGMFTEVHLCTSGKSCISKLSELNQASIVELVPTLVLIDIPYDDDLVDGPSLEVHSSSPGSKLLIDNICGESDIGNAYGLRLLKCITSEIHYRSLSKLVVPIAVVSTSDPSNAAIPHQRGIDSRSKAPQEPTSLITSLDQTRTIRYLDAGAVDVLTSPLLQERLPSLGILAYRAHRDASKDQRALLEIKRGRKRSWVGVNDQKPYAYLREAMVSGLMDRICTLGLHDEPPSPVRITVALDRQRKVAEAVGTWAFSAHDFTDDELLHASLLMLQHALSMPELEKWRVSTDALTGFLVASRSAYNAFVPYHNFRHVVDVLQATFYFLLQLGRLPRYPHIDPAREICSSPIAALIRPFDALTLLITAIGHDVGHPGVNNAFLVTLNAPLAQLYNDRSVLESFHCAAYSQILRRHWPAAFQATGMRQLMINSILATDMGLHFDYMKRLGWMQEKLHDGGDNTDGWNGRLIEDQRTLACSLLIKCADISNVARKFDVARQWTMILTDEFSRQASMEQDLGIPSALFAPPVREIVELGKSQVGFMNMFAIPLFQGVTDVMPAMGFAVNELHLNKSAWETRIQEEQAKLRNDSDDSIIMDGVYSPRTMSLATSTATSHHKTNTSPSTARSSNDSETRIKALLNKSPFSPPNGALEESTEPTPMSSQLLSGFSAASPVDSPPSHCDTAPDNSRHHKPTRLQLGFQNGPLDNESKRASLLGNEGSTGLAANAHLEYQANCTAEEQQGSSDTIESRHSGQTEPISQATSTTTDNVPLSPISQGTSVGSDTSQENPQTPTPVEILAGHANPATGSALTPITGSPQAALARHEGYEGRSARLGSVLNLRKKPSRFRVNSLNFWKKNKVDSPPLPIPDDGLDDKLGLGSSDEVNRWR